MSPVIGSQDVVDPNNGNGTVAETLNIAVEKIDMVIDKAGCEMLGDENDETGNDDTDISDASSSRRWGVLIDTWT